MHKRYLHTYVSLAPMTLQVSRPLLDGAGGPPALQRRSSHRFLVNEKEQMLKVVDASGFTVVSSVKIDSADRKANIDLFVRYFATLFANVEIIFVEQGATSHLQDRFAGRQEISVKLVRDEGPHFKTRNLNLGARLASRPVVYMCDVDVLVPPHAIARSMELFNSGGEFVAPYNGVMAQVARGAICIDEEAAVDPGVFNDFFLSLPHFPKHHEKLGLATAYCYPLYGGSQYDSAGGALLYNRRAFFDAGGWNENIISYGFEDMELLERVCKLGYRFERVDSCNCYHLEHERLEDSYYNNFYRSNQDEYNRVRKMNRDELRVYVDKGFRSLSIAALADVELVNSKDEFALRVFDSPRVDLSNTAILIVVRLQQPRPVPGFHAMLRFLEEHFNGYQIHLVEVNGTGFKYPSDKKNIVYHSVFSAESLETIAADLRRTISRPIVDLYIWDNAVDTSAVLSGYKQMLSTERGRD